MKTNRCLLVICLFVGLASEGCTLFSATHKWDSRIGKFCIHDADRELGLPSKTKKQPNGETTSTWLKVGKHPDYFTNTHYSYYSNNTKWSWLAALGSYTTKTPNPKAGQWWVEERKLVFDGNGYLKSWSKREYDTSILTPELSRELK